MNNKKRKVSAGQKNVNRPKEIVPLENLSDIIDAVDYLQKKCHDAEDNGSKVKVQRNPNIKMAVDVIEQTAREIGLTPQHIDTIVDVVGCSKLPKGLSHRLIKSLIPSSVVPQTSIVSCVSWMSTNSLQSDTKALFLRWILVVFNAIDDKQILHKLYSFLFLFVENTILRPHLCHLLYLLTRKDDVRMFRIRKLLQIHENCPLPQAYVLGVLSVFKLYHPNLVSISIAKSRKVFFRKIDDNWSAAVRKVINVNGPPRIILDNPVCLLPQPTDLYYTPQVKKKKKSEVVPSVNFLQRNVHVETNENETTKFNAFLSSQSKPCLPFSQIRSFDQLLKNLDRFELPNQMCTALKDRNIQHVVSALPDPVLSLRISYWLSHMLHEEFINTYKANEVRQEELLCLLVELSEFLQEGLPVCEMFLTDFLRIWNGLTLRKQIFKLITRLRLCTFADLNEMILEPLHHLFFCSSIYFKCQMVLTLTELLRNFAQIEYSRYKYTVNLQTQQRSSSNITEQMPDMHSVFSQETNEFEPLKAFQDLIEYTDAICLVALQQENNSVLFVNCVLEFFHEVAGLYINYGIPLFQVPSYGTWYSCLFHRNAMIVARLCGLVCKYRKAYEALRGSTQHLSDAENVVRKHSLHQNIHTINTYMTDMCDMLWRNRAFVTQSQSSSSSATASICRLLPNESIERLSMPHLNMRLSFYLHLAFHGYALKFLKVSNPTEGGNQIVHMSAIKQCKDVYLEFLEQEHVYGVGEFIKTCIKRNASSSSRSKSTINETTTQNRQS